MREARAALLILFVLAFSVPVNAQVESTTSNASVSSHDELMAQRKRSRASRQLATQEDLVLLGVNMFQTNVGISADGASLYHYTFNPRVGYFVKDNLAMGVSLDLGKARTVSCYSLSYGAGGFVRRYLGIGLNKKGYMQKLRVFIEGGLTFSAGSATKKALDGTEDNQTFVNFEPYVMPGCSYFLTRRMVVDGGLYISRVTYLHHGHNSIDDVTRVGLNVGFHYLMFK